MFNLKNKIHALGRKTKMLLVSTAMDQRGVAAVEFAFIAPIMLIFYFGMVEISLAVDADRNLSHAASLVGDLSAQDEVVTIDMIENYIYGGLAVLDVNATEARNVGLELYAFTVTSAPGATPRVISETGYVKFGVAIDGGTKFDPSTISDSILTDTSGVVVVRMKYNYVPKFSAKSNKMGSKQTYNSVTSKTFEETFTFKPRASKTVRFDNLNGNSDETQRYEINCTIGTDADSGVTSANCAPA